MRIPTYQIFMLSLLLFVACSNPGESNQDSSNNKEAATQAASSTETEQGKSKPRSQSAVSSIDSLSIVVKQNPNDTSALLQRAQLLLAKNDLRNALFDLLQIKKIDSLQGGMLQTMGEYRMRLNQSRQARDTWTQCANAHPKNISCRLDLCRLLISVNSNEKALEYANQIIKLDPYHAEAHYLKGLIIRNQYQDTTLALTYFQRATELRQDYLEALDMMGVSLAELGDTLAPYYYKRVLKIEPNRADIYYKLGVYYMNQDEINRAIESYTKACQLNPGYVDSYYNLGYIFIQIRDYKEALINFDKAIKARPESNYKSYYGRAYAYEMLGDVIKAKADYRKAIEQMPMYRPAMDGLARLQ